MHQIASPPDPPPATRVADGVWQISTPLPFRPRWVQAYLIQLVDGWMLVDGGLGTDAAWAALSAGVAAVAGGWNAVRMQVLTHMHMDHVGLAARVRTATASTVLMGALDAERMRHAAADPGDEAAYRAGLLRAAGAPGGVRELLEAQRNEAAPLAPPVEVDVPLTGERGEVSGAADWFWLWTPGHTAGHVALFRAEDRTLIGGDAVMEGITPTLGVNRQRRDPVGDYLAALDRLAVLSPARILAGHGPPTGQERIDALRSEALAEGARVEALVDGPPATAWQVTEARYPGRELPIGSRLLALRETRAHLDRLSADAGPLICETVDGVDWFRRRDSAARELQTQ